MKELEQFVLIRVLTGVLPFASLASSSLEGTPSPHLWMEACTREVR